uniref:F-box/LRR-repeat protein 8 n=1 Tax=Arion vulgaris TaxID=1028688 RepID=A0A0B7A9Z8_9EUPU
MAAVTQLFYEDWANLPDPILAHIFSYLSVVERCRIGVTCKHWLQCLETPQLWRNFTCGFYLPGHINLVKCVEQYGCFISRLTIFLNQIEAGNRTNAVSVLEHVANLDEIHLSHLSVVFKGENPLFYGGQEFMTALTKLFIKIGQKKDKSSLKYLNLSGLQANFNNDFIDHISAHCPNLEYLNILNKILVCSVSSNCITNLVLKCRKLRVLHLYHASLSDDVLQAFTEANRKPLQRLGIVCRRQEKYGEDISSEAWSSLLRSNRDLKVELGFDHTCPLHRVSEILKPEIPVEELHLATFTRIYPEINTAVSYYEHVLEKLVVQTRPSKELQEALLSAAQRCRKLKALYVYCVLEKEVIEKILELCPAMKESRNYIMKWTMDPEPWTVGQEDGD